MIISKALINDLYSGNQQKIHASLAALNRLYDLVGNDDVIPKLGQLLSNNKYEKFLLTSTIRGYGVEGENFLINELKRTKDPSLKVAIIIVLSHRLPKHPEYLNLKLENNSLIPNKPSLPGSFCTYVGNNFALFPIGKITPVSMNNDSDNAYLEINSRDLIASLQRLLLVTNADHANPQIVTSGNYNFLDEVDQFDKKIISFKYQNFFFRIGNKDDDDKDIHSNGVITHIIFRKNS